MSWTDERVDILTKLWTEGRTAAEIAKTLGGVTRNAVIGKAHRLKLSNRISPIQQNKKSASVEVKVVKAKLEKKSAPKEPAVSKPSVQKEGVALMDLGSNMCRWPSGDPRDENFSFCGCATIPGLPYCEEHAKVAYQAATRNKILKDQEEDKDDVQVHEQLQKVG